MNKKRFNIFDWFLTLMMFLLIFGNLGNGAQPVRLLIMAAFPVMLADAIRRPHAGLRYYRYVCFFLSGWWLWALAFYFKSEDPTESAKHLVYLFIHIIGFLEVLWAACRGNRPQIAIRNGWLLMVTVSFPLAIKEFLTGDHMANAVVEVGQKMEIHGIEVIRPFACVSFGNLNSYNTVLCWAMPSLFFCNLFPQNKREQLFGFILLFFSIAMIVANASRGAIITMGLMVAVFVYYYYKTGRNRYLLITVITIIVGIFCYYLLDLFIIILNRFQDQGMKDDGRIENFLKGLQALYDSGFLGIGIGNYAPIMGNVYRVQFAAPHNLFMEVLVVYGLPVFIGFTGMLGKLVRTGLRGDKMNRDMLVFCLLAFLAGIIDSQYIMKVPTWMFLSTAFIYTDKRFNAHKTID